MQLAQTLAPTLPLICLFTACSTSGGRSGTAPNPEPESQVEQENELPQSALVGMNLVLGVLENNEEWRPSLRRVHSTYQQGRSGKPDTVKVGLDVTFFSDEGALAATQDCEEFKEAVAAHGWCIAAQITKLEPLEDGQGVFLDGVSLIVDTSRAAKPVDSIRSDPSELGSAPMSYIAMTAANDMAEVGDVDIQKRVKHIGPGVVDHTYRVHLNRDVTRERVMSFLGLLEAASELPRITDIEMGTSDRVAHHEVPLNRWKLECAVTWRQTTLE